MKKMIILSIVFMMLNINLKAVELKEGKNYFNLNVDEVETVIYELGQENSISPRDFINGQYQYQLSRFWFSPIDVNKLGTYEVEVRIGNDVLNPIKTVNAKAIVKDTVVPVVEVKDLEIEEGQTVTVDDFIVSVSDKDTKIEKNIKGDVDYSLGEHTLKIEVKDSSNNVTTKEVKLVVKEKTIEVTYTNSGSVNNWTPSYNNNSNSSSVGNGSNNTGGSQAPTREIKLSASVDAPTEEACWLLYEQKLAENGGAGRGSCIPVIDLNNPVHTEYGWHLGFWQR